MLRSLPRLPRHAFSFVSIPVLIYASFVPISAQNAPAADLAHPAGSLKQTVSNVLVDVVVTGKDGEPVKGLDKGHFQVLENGVPQTVSFFEEHVEQPVSAPAPPPLNLPPNVYSNFDARPANGPTLVLLMDALNTPTGDQVKVRQALLDYLRQVPAGTRMAVFALNERLHMIQGFESDTDQLTTALNRVAAWQKQSRLTDDPGQDTYFDGMPKSEVGGGAADSRTAAMATGIKAGLVSHEQSFRTEARVGITMAALRSLAIYLGALPGRKNLIWFSGSFPVALGGIGHDGSLRIESAQDFTGQIHSISDLLGAARVSVYPVSSGGMASAPAMFNSNLTNNGALHNSDAIISQDRDASADEVSIHGSMERFADETGGHAFYSSNDLGAAIRTVARQGTDYYTVAYTPTSAAQDGKYHKIAVRVDAPKAKLEYRHGYYADDPAKTGVDMLPRPSRSSASLLPGAPPVQQILFKVHISPQDGTTPDPGARSIRYSVNWIADIHGIELPAAENGLRHGAIDLAVVAYDNDGKALSSANNSATLILEPDEYLKYLKSGIAFHQELDLPRGLIHLRFAIVDHNADHSGATEVPLYISAPAPATK